MLEKFFTAKEDPQPQADSDCGLLRTVKALRIISTVKSMVEPRSNSKLELSTTTLQSSFENTLRQQQHIVYTVATKSQITNHK